MGNVFIIKNNDLESDIYKFAKESFEKKEKRYYNSLPESDNEGYIKKKKNFNYFFPKEIDDFVDIVNEFSKRKMTKEEIIYEINSISLSKMKMLYTQVKSILDTKELQGSSNNQEEFEKKHEYVNYIALQEGINPSSIYIIYFMYSSILKK